MAKKDRTVKIEDVFDQLVGAPEIGSEVVVINDRHSYRGKLVKYGKQDGKVKKAFVQADSFFDSDRWVSIHDIFTIEEL